MTRMRKSTSLMLAALVVLLLQSSDNNGVVAFSPRVSVSASTAAATAIATAASRAERPVALVRAPSSSLTATRNHNHNHPNGSPLLLAVQRVQQQMQRVQQQMAQGLATAALATATLATPISVLALALALVLALEPAPALAVESKIIGQLQGSGLVFKDTLQIESFDDPKVKGVTLYISTFQKPLTERLGSNFFTDPAYASVGCAKTGAVAVADNIVTGLAGEEVFEESRSLLFKTLRVQRIYDVDKKTVVYVSFNTRLDKGDDTNKSRFKSSLCAVSLE
jgi:CreA protein